MRPTRTIVAVMLTATVAGCTTHSTGQRTAPAGSATAPPPTTATSAQTTPLATATSAQTTGQTRPGAAAAVAAARSFLATEIGMTDLVAGPFHATAPTTGEVAFRVRHGEGGTLAPPTVPRTVVRLRSAASVWVVVGVRADTIQVATPRPLDRIASPVTVGGRASAFEGTVQVTVKADRPGLDRLVGSGFVTGGAIELGPFSGHIAFDQPAADAGWLLFYDESTASGGSPILAAAAVRVRFAAE
ncbi:MAG TPA: Gmad2 immunoglobulin-like domain-containing protein [Actinomycetes bacterium]|jgi:hypothetical protein|nr:Gmad2 immunoglobulin-like domain-containing protein [Actinomycetes bacterium]